MALNLEYMVLCILAWTHAIGMQRKGEELTETYNYDDFELKKHFDLYGLQKIFQRCKG